MKLYVIGAKGWVSFQPYIVHIFAKGDGKIE